MQRHVIRQLSARALRQLSVVPVIREEVHRPCCAAGGRQTQWAVMPGPDKQLRCRFWRLKLLQHSYRSGGQPVVSPRLRISLRQHRVSRACDVHHKHTPQARSQPATKLLATYA